MPLSQATLWKITRLTLLISKLSKNYGNFRMSMTSQFSVQQQTCSDQMVVMLFTISEIPVSKINPVPIGLYKAFRVF
jgi:hypothetical protein